MLFVTQVADKTTNIHKSTTTSRAKQWIRLFPDSPWQLTKKCSWVNFFSFLFSFHSQIIFLTVYLSTHQKQEKQQNPILCALLLLLLALLGCVVVSCNLCVINFEFAHYCQYSGLSGLMGGSKAQKYQCKKLLLLYIHEQYDFYKYIHKNLFFSSSVFYFSSLFFWLVSFNFVRKNIFFLQSENHKTRHCKLTVDGLFIVLWRLWIFFILRFFLKGYSRVCLRYH